MDLELFAIHLMIHELSENILLLQTINFTVCLFFILEFKNTVWDVEAFDDCKLYL